MIVSGSHTCAAVLRGIERQHRRSSTHTCNHSGIGLAQRRLCKQKNTPIRAPQCHPHNLLISHAAHNLWEQQMIVKPADQSHLSIPQLFLGQPAFTSPCPVTALYFFAERYRENVSQGDCMAGNASQMEYLHQHITSAQIHGGRNRRQMDIRAELCSSSQEGIN